MIEKIVTNAYGACIICGKIGFRKYYGKSVSECKRLYKTECREMRKFRNYGL